MTQKQKPDYERQERDCQQIQANLRKFDSALRAKCEKSLEEWKQNQFDALLKKVPQFKF